MKKILFFFAGMMILISCSGAETIPEPTASPVVGLPTPHIVQITPTPEPTVDIGAQPENISGISFPFWYALSGGQATLLEQEIAKFNIVNQYGIRVEPIKFNTLFEMGKALEDRIEPSPGLILDQLIDLNRFKFELIDWSHYMLLNGSGLDGANFINSPDNWTSIPFTRSARYLLYNSSFAQELGFNNAPKTFEEFEEQICAANQFWKTDEDLTNDNFGGYLLADDASWQEPISWMAIGTKDGSAAGFDLKIAEQNLLKLEQLREDSCIWYTTDTNPIDGLQTRKAIITSIDLQSLSEFLSAIKTSGSQDQILLITYPGEVKAVLYGLDLFIPKTEPEIQLAAYLFSRWLLDDQRQAVWSFETGLLPVTYSGTKKILTEDMITDDLIVAVSELESSIEINSMPELNKNRMLFGDGFYEWVTRYPFVELDEILDAVNEITE